VPEAWRNRLRELIDRAIGFAREVASRTDNEGDARRATSLLYHVASAVALAWEGGRIHEMRGDAKRLLLSRMVIDHRVSAGDPFRLTENTTERAITDHLLGERNVGMAEVGELLVAA
jgi:acyl-CoA dehydrogenase